jgi:hypothetical protein
VALEGSRGERPATPDAPPLKGTTHQIAAALRELAEAGADEEILVVDPISERSIRELGDVVALVRA